MSWPFAKKRPAPAGAAARMREVDALIDSVLAEDAALRGRDVVIRPLADHLADPASVARLNQLVADSLLSGDDVSATLAPRRQFPSAAGAAAGRQGAGVDRHLYAVSCQVIQIEQLRAARARRLARGGRRPTGGRAA